MNIANEIKDLRKDIKVIRQANNYTNEYLKFGSCCDSSDRKSRRMMYAKQAEQIFVDDNKRNILKLAALLAEKELNQIKEIVNKSS